ncbi:MAG: hypothetical protein NW214_12425 [Pseudanabaenaceae cyanobacterium bins.39]|nr:hypothetical protein [Pseudanabaenaceae cyanobacterium bins.39]
MQSLIEQYQLNQAQPNQEGATRSPSQQHPQGVWTTSGMKPLLNSLVGFAFERGDRLLINGAEVTFKGWVDQSQTAIEVQALDDDSIQKIRAQEILSLSRSPLAQSQQNSKQDSQDGPQPDNAPSDHANPTENNPKAEPQSEPNDHEVKQDLQKDEPETPEQVENDVPEAPAYNAWEVWTYLERQRLKTLKLINTFEAEWEANRFVREAERNTPPNLRIHYEIRPIVLDETATTIHTSASGDAAVEPPEFIDVEIIS